MTSRGREGCQVITWVLEGALAHAGSSVGAGEIQWLTPGPRDPGETNTSRTEWAHYFQLSLRSPGVASQPGSEQKRFSAAQHRGWLCVVATPEGAVVYSAVLAPGQPQLLPGRSAWLHLVHGELTLGDLTLTSGDGAGLTGERAVSVTARVPTELSARRSTAAAPTP